MIDDIEYEARCNVSTLTMSSLWHQRMPSWLCAANLNHFCHRHFCHHSFHHHNLHYDLQARVIRFSPTLSQVSRPANKSFSPMDGSSTSVLTTPACVLVDFPPSNNQSSKHQNSQKQLFPDGQHLHLNFHHPCLIHA